MSLKCPSVDEAATFSEERLGAYASIVGESELEELFQLGESLHGMKL